MKVITFSLQTQQPLLATSFQGDPNSDVSYSFIPGSMIRGAIIGRYMKQHNLSELDLSKDEVNHLFFNINSTRYLNAYLQSHEGKRTLPVPRSWFKEKDTELIDEFSEIRVYDFSLGREEELENYKFISEGLWTKERGCVRLYKEKRRINIHNQRDRKKGRSIQIKHDPETDQFKGEGEIFRYEAIETGETFQAVINISEWLEQQHEEYKLKYILAHAEDGVIWGEFRDGQLVTADSAFSHLPKLRPFTLQQCRAFGEKAEVMLWQTDEGFQARLVQDENDTYSIPENQILWGTQADKVRNGFTLVSDGQQGLRHAVPLIGIEFDKNQTLYRPLRLTVHHYIDSDEETGLARIYLSRLVNLTIKKELINATKTYR